MTKTRVMIVEDSPSTRELLRHIISQDSRLEVAAAVESGEEALRLLNSVAPDVISMDIRLPGMDGIEATKRIMSERATPIVVIAAPQPDDARFSMNALRAGALALLEKPVGVTHSDYTAMASRICTQLHIMSQVKVVRQRFNSGGATSARIAVVTNAPAARRVNSSHIKILGVVASTGGPNAVAKLLNSIGADFPLPVVLVQHITPTFLDGFVSWLRGICPFDVKIAAEGEMAAAGNVYVPPANRHLCVNADGTFKIDASEPVSYQRPSGTVLFRSLAAAYKSRALGVLLTGMGDDGAQGLLELRRSGAYTIAESESTAVVYGMPAEAHRLGAACEMLPLPSIAPRILEQLEATREMC